MRTLPALAAAALLLTTLGTAAPAVAHGDADRNREVRSQLLAQGTTTPLMSDNVALQSSNPGTVGISGCFMKTAPLYVTSGLEAVTVWDVSDATRPTRAGVLANPVFENEAMNCGERRTSDGVQRFVLIGIDLYQASPDDPAHVNAGGNELMVVDVTDPAAPTIVGRVPSQTSTHTVACVDERNCRYAYSAGDRGSGTFSIFDLTDITQPVELDSDPGTEGVQAFDSPTAAHKWNFDAADVGTHTGFDGSSMWDVSDPRDPRLLATTGKAGGAGEGSGVDGYNDFIHHNSFRPNAKRFKPRSRPSFRNGNVLLVTEEDYEQTDCSQAGSFQTWHVKRLNGRPGGIVPLDKVELSDLGNFPVPQGAFCSAHWFDYRKGVVAIGFYGGGTQFIDVRRPTRLKPYGHAHWFASEVWDAMWVPVYDDRGRQTGRTSNVVYAIDLVRGLDVYSVDVPGKVGLEPTTGSRTADGLSTRASAGVLPVGVVAGALGLAVALRRRTGRSGGSMGRWTRSTS